MGGFMYGLLIFVEIVTSLLLIGFILLQKTKDEGLGLAFGAGVGETLFGSRAGNVLTKITIGLAVVFLAHTLLFGYISSGKASSGSVTDREPASIPAQTAPAGGLPGMPGSQPGTIPAAGGTTAPLQFPASTTR